MGSARQLGAVAAGAGMVGAAVYYVELSTGVPTLDRFPIRGRVALYSMIFAPLFVRYGITPLESGRLVMALILKESRGDPANYVGDDGRSASVGNTLHSTAEELGLVPAGLSDDDYIAQYAGDEGWGVRAVFFVLLSKLRAAGGDLKLALARYNGAGPKADQYLADVEADLWVRWGVAV